MTIYLTVSPKGDRTLGTYRLKVNPSDNNKNIYFTHGESMFLIDQEIEINLSYRNTDKCKHELDSLRGLLNEWIINRNFHNYSKGNPTKLIFDLFQENGCSKIIFIGPLCLA